MCSYDKLCPCLFLFIHIALSPPYFRTDIPSSQYKPGQLNTHPYSKCIGPSIPQIFGLSVLNHHTSSGYPSIRIFGILSRCLSEVRHHKQIHAQKQNVPGLTLCLCMAACGHRADGQLGLAFEEFPNAFHLIVEVAALRGGEVVEWLHCDVEFVARAAQVPDPGNCPVNEQHREVSRLTSGSQRTFGSPAGKEQLARLAADRVGIDVGQQPYAR